MGLVDGLKLFFLKPEEFFKKVEKESLRQSMVFIKPMIVVTVLVGFVIAVAQAMRLPEKYSFMQLPTILGFWWQAFVVFVLGPIILHSCFSMKLFGGKATEEKTKQVYLYTVGIAGIIGVILALFVSIASALFGFLNFIWIVPIALIGLGIELALLVSFIKGLAILHKIGKAKAFAAIVLSAIILLIIFVFGWQFILGITGAQYALYHTKI